MVTSIAREIEWPFGIAGVRDSIIVCGRVRALRRDQQAQLPVSI